MPDRRLLLICDLDGTLIPPDRNAADKEPLERFRRLVVSRDDLCLAYATGRHFELALEGVASNDLPAPDALLCEVGSRAYRRVGGTFIEDEAYTARLRGTGGGPWDQGVRAALDAMPGLEPQEDDKQGPFKISFYTAPAMVEAEILDGLDRRLGELRESVSIVFSVDTLDGRGLLDIMPAGVSKAAAVDYLRRDLGLSPSEVVYAGDSGNDAAALLSGVCAILVGNATDELRARLRAESERKGIAGNVYFARRHYVGGVLEGCERFGLFGRAPD